MSPKKATGGKMQLNLWLSRGAIADIGRIGAKRLESGAARRETGQSAIVEEAIALLKKKEGI